MKNILIHIAIIFSLTTDFFGQDVKSEVKSEIVVPEQAQVSNEAKKQDLPVLENENKKSNENSGLDELKRQRRNRNSHFIDKDGDGINDNRCNGLGVQRGSGKGKGKRSGKK